MVDFEAINTEFINRTFVQKHGLKQKQLKQYINLYEFDRTWITTKWITHTVSMKLKHKEHKKRIFLLVTMLDKHEIILKMPWMQKHKINFDWKHEELLFTADVCWKHYMNLKSNLKSDSKSDLKSNTKSEPIWNLKMKPTKAQTLYLSNKKHDHWKYSFKRAIQQPEPEYETE